MDCIGNRYDFKNVKHLKNLLSANVDPTVKKEIKHFKFVLNKNERQVETVSL